MRRPSLVLSAGPPGRPAMIEGVLGPRWLQDIPKAWERERADDETEDGTADPDAPAPRLGDRGAPVAKPRLPRTETPRRPQPPPSQPPAADVRHGPVDHEPSRPAVRGSQPPPAGDREPHRDRSGARGEPRGKPVPAPRKQRGEPEGAPAAWEGVAVPAADAVVAHSAATRPRERRERDAFEVASMVFGGLIAFFGAWGAIATIGGGIGSAGFVISMVFVVLGLGRLYYGFRGHEA